MDHTGGSSDINIGQQLHEELTTQVLPRLAELGAEGAQGGGVSSKRSQARKELAILFLQEAKHRVQQLAAKVRQAKEQRYFIQDSTVAWDSALEPCRDSATGQTLNHPSPLTHTVAHLSKVEGSGGVHCASYSAGEATGSSGGALGLRHELSKQRLAIEASLAERVVATTVAERYFHEKKYLDKARDWLKVSVHSGILQMDLFPWRSHRQPGTAASSSCALTLYLTLDGLRGWKINHLQWHITAPADRGGEPGPLFVPNDSGYIDRELVAGFKKNGLLGGARCASAVVVGLAMEALLGQLGSLVQEFHCPEEPGVSSASFPFTFMEATSAGSATASGEQELAQRELTAGAEDRWTFFGVSYLGGTAWTTFHLREPTAGFSEECFNVIERHNFPPGTNKEAQQSTTEDKNLFPLSDSDSMTLDGQSRVFEAMNRVLAAQREK